MGSLASSDGIASHASDAGALYCVSHRCFFLLRSFVCMRIAFVFVRSIVTPSKPSHPANAELMRTVRGATLALSRPCNAGSACSAAEGVVGGDGGGPLCLLFSYVCHEAAAHTAELLPALLRVAPVGSVFVFLDMWKKDIDALRALVLADRSAFLLRDLGSRRHYPFKGLLCVKQ